ncbi:hypothetical protein BGI41_02005 [Methanobrevibacter sp. 87.7]|uniref:DUF4422 domain-containing protein n=1 Tax=Methanobrevibacter sp. 87.7 TaxID=387957 RepID=UPI000B664790|nr:DUF4422 domain-containing protein [Methanobrevibacter sp. 87.7]OWT33513.1 hypothetical protein BGI41_02005 [Methanobrevibacter sp. 87.7]
MSKNVQIYVISHKEVEDISSDNLYTPLFVGSKGKKTPIDSNGNKYQIDDSGENISSRNPDYAELTGLYWMWKNSSADILGLVHYRRYFMNNNHKINKEEILSYLNDYDIILPKKIELLKGSYGETYKDSYLIHVLDVTRDVISKKYPDYLDTYDEIIKEDSFFNFNMFIMNKDLLNNYCTWLFTILKDVEHQVDLTIIKRVLGLVSELIFNVWIRKNNLKIKELEIKYIGTGLNFRMSLSKNNFLRYLYRKFYFKHVKNVENSKLENFIQNLFFK